MIAASVLALAIGSGLAGCTDNREERGLAEPDEVAAPFDDAEASKTEAERERENLEMEQ